MGLRRLSGLLLMLTTVNLAAAGSDLVCAKHIGGHHAGAQPADPAMDHHSDSGSPEKDPCTVPARSDCCAAMTSCAPSMSLVVVVTRMDAPKAHHERPRSSDGALLTRLIPPDPPPPKV